ncbi:alpha-L-arabinofuranosidase C-terminal domain-containing protein [Paraflavitalea sp. CAU 1676]|uniref:alpha-N-arabinofuranosidase n=1 Tax=Paraflavitalea sp. CAU 1676 TaxID=3032598 RepID=UPI0023DA0502|nr:alpha-L-arabinofuranosidase C-terminal domain-containing protein [Paraflavitalea sp. CAU 1676]MDF2190534.1 alpha-L-arabinofuranosidase C-terminal domain-containing protein [Paraflavitalea sp. CAU 1676]
MKNLLFFFSLFMSSIAGRAQHPIVINMMDTSKVVISKHIYGHFAEHLGRCVYDGLLRNGTPRKDMIAALRKIRIPNLRWPGGCFADEYHWRNGIGPQDKRPKTVNTTWGMVVEDNSFGTHEFLDLCEQIGAEPYLAGNMGSGTPQEMADWIEYMNYGGISTLTNLRSRNGHPNQYGVSWWGVGNESWGCGGDMTPEHYSNLYKQYANFCKSYPGVPRLKKIVSGANADDYRWTEVVMKNIPIHLMWGLSLHYYTWLTGNWPPTGGSTNFPKSEYTTAMRQAWRMDEIVTKHSAIMDQYDPLKNIALVVDEWGIWVKQEPDQGLLYQQNSLRDALLAALTLNIFNNHADRVRGANLAQVANVIHSIVLTSGDSMLLTPTYHVFDLYKVHQDSRHILVKYTSPSYVHEKDTIACLSVSASRDSIGHIHVSLVNMDVEKSLDVSIPISGRTISGQIITSPKVTDHNTFGDPDKVVIKPFNGFLKQEKTVQVLLPPKSIVVLEARDGVVLTSNSIAPESNSTQINKAVIKNKQ